VQGRGPNETRRQCVRRQSVYWGRPEQGHSVHDRGALHPAVPVLPQADLQFREGVPQRARLSIPFTHGSGARPPHQGSWALRTAVGTSPPTRCNKASRSFAGPVYFTAPSRFTSSGRYPFTWLVDAELPIACRIGSRSFPAPVY